MSPRITVRILSTGKSPTVVGDLLQELQMKFITVSDDFFNLCKFDKELLYNTNRRPYLLVVKLDYKSSNYDFAIPFRSNLSYKTPKNQYFSLPPRPKTKPGYMHGLHYIKMFPITKQYFSKFHTENDRYYEIINGVIEKRLSIIICESQNYLNQYAEGLREPYCTNIDAILSALCIDECSPS